ncbi:LamG-like jellyroll fold domain-containing protein [Nonomuraea sp. SBT364]|uniref:LamG-like jellyroll fold domain-containing protein n=1 Tax=Nonomuraea sp. SBT364 TaxID=1580530 RepID=UPI0012E25948|nr:LamG-like jellyroll fold domain-containing protein [Nonomuraea sp. SBT364]
MIILAGGVAQPADAAAATGTTALVPDCRPSTVEADAARAIAEACGEPVEVESLRTPTTQVLANRDGTSTVEIYAHPRWARRADGSWARPDAGLEAREDGSVAPRASALGLVLSGGGAGPLLRARHEGRDVALSWPDPLPEPVLEGARATYPEVLAGVGLVVTARDTGFSFVLVVKDRKAAQNPRLRGLALGSSLSGLTWQKGDDGGLRAVDAKGRTVLGAPAPRMWDSAGTRSAGTGIEAVEQPARGAAVAAVKVDLGADGRLTLVPDRGLLTDPAARFPLIVDPDIGYASWTMINEYSGNQSYWNYDRRDCSGAANSECGKVGYYVDPVRYRSMFSFPPVAVHGKDIIGASMWIDLVHSASCTASTTEMRVVHTDLGPGTTWDNTWASWEGGNVDTVVNSSCRQVRTPTEFDATSAVKRAASERWSRLVLGLKAYEEGSAAGWKKFDAVTAKLAVTMNSPPDAPGPLFVDGKPCAVGAGRPFVATRSPTLRAGVRDADGNSLKASFYWRRVREDGSLSPAPQAPSKAEPEVPSGSTAQVNGYPGVLEPGEQMVATGDVTRDGRADVLIRDGDGYLYALPGWSRQLAERVPLGTGWGGFTVAGVTDWDKDGRPDLVARNDATGELRLYPGGAAKYTFDAPVTIGVGWGGYTLAGLADWDRDGHVDVIARDGGGGLWLYPGESKRVASTQPRVTLGSGWNGFTYFGTIDWDRDGAPDVLARDPSNGVLWLYPGSGGRSAYSGSPGRFEVGSGWYGYQAFTTPDIDDDGKADIVADPPDTTTWYGYQGSGTRSGGGSRWPMAAIGLSPNSTYQWWVTAADSRVSGPASQTCEFTVDVAKPVTPRVTSDVYKEGTDVCDGGACGSVGQTGRFTFASASPDVVLYKWGFDDPPAADAVPAASGGSVSVEWVPAQGGQTTLYVAAVDRAGNASRKEYRFVVGSPAPPRARWKLSDPAGSSVLADATGNGRDLTVMGTPVLGEPGRLVPGFDGEPQTAMRVDATSGYASSPDLLDTSRSFSVSAWAMLGGEGVDQTVVASQGSQLGPFYLGATDRWVMLVPSRETDDGQVVWWHARSATVPRVGVWTHLAGTYDSAAKTLRLYVNGVLEGTVTGVTTFDASGEVWVGKGGTPLRGSVADVRVWDRKITDAEVFDLADPMITGRAGEWDFDEVYSRSATDTSGKFRDMPLFGGAHMPPGGGHPGSALHLNGKDAYAAVDGPALRTDQSFTVAAWVRVADLSRAQTFVSQQGAGAGPGFALSYDPADNGRWVWSVPASPADTTNVTSAAVAAVTPADYHHLTGVLDVQTRSLRLYVDRKLQTTARLNAAWQPWQAEGALLVGRAHQGTTPAAFVDGAVDGVRLFQGVVSDVSRIGSVNRSTFTDTFSDGSTGGWKHYNGAWSESGGVLSVNSGEGHRAVVDGAWVDFADFTFEADVRIASASGEAGVVFRNTADDYGLDAYRGYYAGFDGTSMVLGRMDTAWKVLSRVPVAAAAGAFHHLKVVAHSGRIQVFFGDAATPQIDVVDTGFRSGGIGVRAVRTGAAFDNVSVVRNTVPKAGTLSSRKPAVGSGAVRPGPAIRPVPPPAGSVS